MRTWVHGFEWISQCPVQGAMLDPVLVLTPHEWADVGVISQLGMNAILVDMS